MSCNRRREQSRSRHQSSHQSREHAHHTHSHSHPQFTHPIHDPQFRASFASPWFQRGQRLAAPKTSHQNQSQSRNQSQPQLSSQSQSQNCPNQSQNQLQSQSQSHLHQHLDQNPPDYPPIYTRGHSAPPPESTSSTTSTSAPAACTSATLFQDAPVHFRLGGGLPWDLGQPEPASDPDDLAIKPFTRPTVLSIETDDDDFVYDDPVHKKNLESLSAAMMTVDNGFEGQWWNSGPKVSLVPPQQQEEVDESPILGSLSHFPTLQPRPTQPSLGWAVPQPVPQPAPAPSFLHSEPSPQPPSTSSSAAPVLFSPSVVSPTLSELSFFSHSDDEQRISRNGYAAVPQTKTRGRPDLVSPESEYAVPWAAEAPTAEAPLDTQEAETVPWEDDLAAAEAAWSDSLVDRLAVPYPRKRSTSTHRSSGSSIANQSGSSIYSNSSSNYSSSLRSSFSSSRPKTQTTQTTTTTTLQTQTRPSQEGLFLRFFK